MKNLQAILKWSAGQDIEEKDREQVSQIDPDKKAYLEKVLATMTIDTVDKMKRILNVMHLDEEIAAGDFDVNAAKIAALEELHDLIEDVDNATDFLTIGGVGVCYTALNNEHTPIRELALSCLASAAQNHPAVQTHLHKTGGVDKIIDILKNPDNHNASSSSLLEKSVRSLSCIIRGQDLITEEFIRKKGTTLLANLISISNKPSTNLIIKVAYLTASLALDFAPFRKIVRLTGLLDRLVECLTHTSDDTVWEQCLRALVNCVGEDNSNRDHLFTKTELKTLLDSRQTQNSTRSQEELDAILEELEYTKQLLK